MQISQIPAKMPLVWAQNAGSGYIRAIPSGSQIGITNGAASLNDGYPPLCFASVGGVLPSGLDFNGIFKWVTQWSQWQQAGATVSYDSTFSTAIGGYPKGSVLASSSSAELLWMNTADNNTTNPDSSGTNWSAATFPAGTTMLFFQASAPAGWTQVTTYNDCALRIVSGTGAGYYTAGQAFSTATASGTVAGHSITQAELPNCSFTVTDPGHPHGLEGSGSTGGSGHPTLDSNTGTLGSTDTATTGITVASGGSGTAHTHAFTSSALGINYLDAIICTKA